MTRELLQRSFDALEPIAYEGTDAESHRVRVLRQDIRAHLAQPEPEPEPVAWMSPGKERLEFVRKDTVFGSHTIPLYTHPPAAQPAPVQTSELWRKGMAEKMAEAARLDATPVPAVPTDELGAFEAWWDAHGQYVRAGGGDYEKSFAYAAWVFRPAPPAQAVPLTPLTEDQIDAALAPLYANETAQAMGREDDIRTVRAIERAHSITAPETTNG